MFWHARTLLTVLGVATPLLIGAPEAAAKCFGADRIPVEQASCLEARIGYSRGRGTLKAFNHCPDTGTVVVGYTLDNGTTGGWGMGKGYPYGYSRNIAGQRYAEAFCCANKGVCNRFDRTSGKLCRTEWTKSPAAAECTLRSGKTSNVDGARKCRLKTQCGNTKRTGDFAARDVAKLKACFGRRVALRCVKTANEKLVDRCRAQWDKSAASKTCQLRDAKVKKLDGTNGCWLSTRCGNRSASRVFAVNDVRKLKACSGRVDLRCTDTNAEREAKASECRASWGESQASRHCRLRTARVDRRGWCFLEARCGPTNITRAGEFKDDEVPKLHFCSGRLWTTCVGGD